MSFLPIHPAVVHLPIAFVLLSAAADLCARLAKSEQRRAAFRTVGFWSLLAALIGGVLAIAAGYLDLHRDALAAETSTFVELHMTIGWALAVCLVFLWAWRWLIWHRGQMTINTSYLIAVFVVLGLTFFQGWYGGEMVYSYGAGVAPTGQGTETTQAAQSRLIAVRNVLAPAAPVGGAETPGGTNTPPPASGQ